MLLATFPTKQILRIFVITIHAIQTKSFLVLATLLVVICIGCKGQVNTNTQNDSVYTTAPGSIDGIGKFYMGREIAHVMGAAGSEWLERSSRQQEEHSAQAIDSLPLQPNSIVADIGAGTGYYTFRIAQKIPGGNVYAIDVQDEMVSQLESKKKAMHVNNVDIIKGGNTSPNLPTNSVDLAIMVDVYHELDHPHEMLQSLYKALKPSGKLLLLEYRKEDPSIPIKELHKMSVQQANKELKANGFVLYQRKEFLPIQHYLLYVKADNNKR